MLTQEMNDILEASREIGWVMEPQAKRFFSLAGLDVPKHFLASGVDDAIRFGREVGYPVVGKVVSPQVVHKSEKNGVEVGIEDDAHMRKTFDRFSTIEGFAGMLIEEMHSGLELIIGAKNDYQFGPVILFGMGGIWAEVYKDVVLKMAPLREPDMDSMRRCLKARPLLEGYRGSAPVNVQALNKLLTIFSDLVIALEKDFESIDLNPVICSPNRCIIADARILLQKE